MSKDVKSYYDQNTKLFLKLSGNNHTASIHQPLWFEGTKSRSEALNNTDNLIIEEIKEVNHADPRILDLGCGVGGSIFYLLGRLPSALAHGLTISPRQVEIANELAKQKKLSGQTTFVEGSYQEIPAEIPNVNLAFSIEAFVHATDAEKFFEEAYRKLLPGGRLVLVDDFLSETPLETNRQKGIISDFEDGWMLGSLLPISKVNQMAVKAGFEHLRGRDLTSFLPIDSLRDKLIRIYLHSFRWLLKNTSYFKSQIGGNARQLALKNGLVQYHKITFQKPLKPSVK